MSDAEKILAKLYHINEVHIKNAEDEDGDKYLSQSSYAMEAIDAALNGTSSPILDQFMAAEA